VIAPATAGATCVRMRVSSPIAQVKSFAGEFAGFRVLLLIGVTFNSQSPNIASDRMPCNIKQ
jgi:hypothetical protein